jgi:hypothetical protein
MSAIGSVDTSATQATQAALAGTATTPTQTQSPASGLPPASLAAAASANTLNAELATSQWGVDPNSVGGVYGGSGGSTDSGGIFSGTSLLPVLTNLTHANAEQALALIGINIPKPGGTSGGSSGSTGTQPQSQSSLAQAAYSGSTPMVVDPLWGRSA